MNPHDLLFAHRYQEYAEYCEAELAKNPNKSGMHGSYARGLMCLNLFERALFEYLKADELDEKQLKDQPYLNNIGSIYWILGKQENAIKAFRNSVDGILDGTIEFADLAGGVSQGLLLWYAGISSNNEVVIKHSLKYLNKLSKKSRIKNWPGPLALFVLGKLTEEETLLEAYTTKQYTSHPEVCKTNNLYEAIEIAKTDLLKRRHLVQTLFYFAVKKRELNLESECMELMKLCADLDNPIIENEWYLANHEIKQHSS